MAPNELLITADTIVCQGGEVMGKPKGVDQAKEMLRRLSGNVHQVITGVTIVAGEHMDNFAVTTHVKFAELSDDEINFYVDNYLPFDKAGSYGIQEWIGLVAVEEIRGSYFNVVGLPVQRLYQRLKEF